jgi:hypothetical protein
MPKKGRGGGAYKKEVGAVDELMTRKTKKEK